MIKIVIKILTLGDNLKLHLNRALGMDMRSREGRGGLGVGRDASILHMADNWHTRQIQDLAKDHS